MAGHEDTPNTDAQAGNTSPGRPQRRQNTSCDHCRRSKRRCVVPPQTDSCANCSRLGRTCTFNFAKSRTSIKPKRRQVRGPIVHSPTIPENALDIPNNAAQRENGPEAATDAWVSWLDLDLDDFFDESASLCFQGNTGHGAVTGPSGPQIATTAARYIPTPSTDHNFHMEQHNLSGGYASIVGRSLNSPVHLLNSKMNLYILDDNLVGIYETIVTGSASRFMDQKCNLYAAGHPYKLEDNTPPESTDFIYQIPREMPSFPSNAVSDVSTPELLPAGPDPGFRMTVLGTVRFLDHFADLYENRMRTADKRQSDAVLKAVLRAFALQWLPSSPSPWSGQGRSESLEGRLAGRDILENVFNDAWHSARSLLKEAQTTLSFRVVYAMLMFDGIAIPQNASTSLTEVTEHEFLDQALEKLSYLDGLAQKYRDKLGPSSEYGTLLEASLNIVRWGGYVRDTGAALTSNRRCKLPDLFSQMTKSSGLGPNGGPHPDLDDSVSGTCRTAFAGAFSVWRQVINVRNSQLVKGASRISPRIIDCIQASVTSVGNFNQWFRPFMAHCLDNFSKLSMSSRIFCVSFAMVWDLGVFVLAEGVKPVMNELKLCNQTLLVSAVESYQREAISSVTQTVEHVLALTSEGSFNLRNGLSVEAPIFAYHITPGLMIAALEKGVGQIIDLQLYPTFNSRDVQGDEQFPVSDADGSWYRQIDVLMKGLLSLSVTIGGSQTTRPILESLMRKYGDILSECWSCDFDN